MTGLGDGELESAREMAAALQEGQVSSVELVDRALARAGAWQPVTNAFSQLWADEALADARRIDAQGPPAGGPLAGIPIAVKDLYDVAGHETTGCCRAYAGRVAARDAPAIDAVRRAGLVMVGKTNQHELAAGGSNLVSACGRTGNPWDPERMTGGSSGGSGAAVAAGMVPWALGSDTGGSIRIPAAMCGTFGLKPTTGRLSIEGMLPLSPSMDCPGPMASTSMDTRLLFLLLAGDLDAAARTARTARPRYAVGLVEGYVTERLHPAVASALAGTGATLEEAGAEVERVDGRGIEDGRRTWMDVCGPEFSRAHQGIRRDLVAPQVVEWMEHGDGLSDERRAGAAMRRGQIRAWFLERLEGRDALLVPTTAYPAPPADAEEVDLGPAGTVAIADLGPGWLTCPVNLAGLPAISLPAGRSPEGLPVGVSLVGPPDSEATLLGVATWWESATGHRPARPPAPPAGAALPLSG